MTNAEIERRVKKLLPLPGLPLSPEMVTWFEKHLADNFREAVSQAYEEAAQAQCVYCKGGPPQLVSGKWLHKDDGLWAGCDALGIRALKASLNPPPPAEERERDV